MCDLLDGLLRSADFSVADRAVNYFVIRTGSRTSRLHSVFLDRRCGSMCDLLDGLLRSADFSVADGAVDYFVIRTISSASCSHFILTDCYRGSVCGIHRHCDGLALVFCIRGSNGVYARPKSILAVFIRCQICVVISHGFSTSHCEVDLATVSLAVFNANKCDLRRQHGIVLTLIEYKILIMRLQSLVQ